MLMVLLCNRLILDVELKLLFLFCSCDKFLDDLDGCPVIIVFTNTHVSISVLTTLQLLK